VISLHKSVSQALNKLWNCRLKKDDSININSENIGGTLTNEGNSFSLMKKHGRIPMILFRVEVDFRAYSPYIVVV
jgi:hypothetical protein